MDNINETEKNSDIIQEPPQKAYKTKKAIFRTYQVLWYILAVIEILLGFRVFLKLIGANSFSGFTEFIYNLSGPFAVPFNGVISPSIGGTSVMEWSTLLAMAVYAVGIWLIIRFFEIIKPVKPEEIEQAVDKV